MDLGEAERRPERLGDPPGPADVDGLAVAVGGSDALKQEIPCPGSYCRTMLPCTALSHCCHSAGTCPGATSSMRTDEASHTAHGRSYHHRLGHLGLDLGLALPHQDASGQSVWPKVCWLK